MPNSIAAALAAKAAIAKVCTVALIAGGAGWAYTDINQPDTDELGSVSVEYALQERAVLAFTSSDYTPMTDLLISDSVIPARFEGHTPKPEAGSVETGVPGDALTDEDAKAPAATESGSTAKNSDEKAAEEAEKKAAEEAEKKAAEEAEEAEKKAAEEAEKAELEADKTAPPIKVLYPTDGSHFEKKVLVFEGTTEPGAKVFAGRYQASVDAKGNWRIELVLSPGANGAVFTATDAAGNSSTQKVTVWLDVEEPKEEPKHEEELKEEPKHEEEEPYEVEFYANQKYGSCDAEVPYEIFWGKATPHTEVVVTSPYGSGVTETGKKGHWEIKLYFPNAPRNQPFNITVAGANGSKTFSYVAVGAVEAPEGEEGHEETPEHPEDEA